MHPGSVIRVHGYQFFALLLIKLLFLEHADLVLGCVHAPVFDIHVELRQIEIQADGLAVKNAKTFIIPVSDLLTVIV